MNFPILNPLVGEGSRQSHMRLWVGVLLVGIVVIFVVRPALNLGPWTSAIILCLLMLIYGWITHKNERVLPDTKGDGMYYLGLLFTFAALVAALARFPFATSADNLTPLIANFGIALVTTILGLAGRVWFAMGQESPGDIAESAVRELDVAVDTMKRQVVRSGQTFESLVGHLEASEEVWKETFDRITGGAKAMEDFFQITRHLAQSVRTFWEASNEMVSSAVQMTDPMHDLGKRIARLNDESEKFGEALEQARLTLDSLDGSRFTSGVADFERTATEAATLISQLRNPLEQAGRTISEFGEKAGAGMQAFSEVENAGQRIKKVAAELTDLSDVLDRLENVVQGVEKNGEGVSKGIAGASEAVENIRAAAENAAKPLQQAAKDAGQLTDHVADLREKTDGIGSDLSVASEASKQIRQNLEAANAKKSRGLFGRRRRPS